MSNAFTYTGSISVTSISPNSGFISGGTTVTITGTNFQSGATVQFGSLSATSVTVTSSTQIQAVTPAQAAGAVTLQVTNPDGSAASLSNGFTYVTLSVSNITPQSGPPAGGTTVTITGANFQSNSTVSFGGVAATSVTVVNSTQITAVTPAHASGTVDVRVQSSTAAATLTGAFTYLAAPTVSSVTPSSGPIGGGTTVTITGTNFLSGLSVSFGGTLATSVNVVSTTQIAAVTPAHPAGAVNVQVTNSGGQGATLTNGFTYLSGISITGVSPQSGPTTGATTVTITGTSFQSGASVAFGGVAAASVTFVSANQLQAVTPAHAAGSVDVTVTNPDSTSATLPLGFSFATGVSVGSVAPNTGPASGGTVVTITGTGFDSTATVIFGSTSSTSVTFVSATQLTAVTPAHAAGVVNVQVQITTALAPLNSATLLNGFTYLGTPTISGVSPSSGPTAGGTLVTITGTAFAGTAVTFGGVAATSVLFVSATQLSAVTPAHATGAVDVKVTNPDSTSATLTGGFTYNAPPTVSSITPNSGSTTVGEAVTITGTGFQPGLTVGFADITAPVTSVSSTQIQATSPVSTSAGTVNVSVTNPDGQTGVLASAFTYLVSKTVSTTPAISSVSPTHGPPTGGTTVTITGTNYQSGATVTFGGTPGTGVTLLSGSQLTVFTPAHNSGPVDLTVTNSDGSSGTLLSGYTFDGPFIGSVSPVVADLSGGTVITITGTGFQVGATVLFGGVLATTINVASPTQIIATAPAHALGAVNVQVTNPDGATSILPNGLTYVPPPRIGGLSPTSGLSVGGTTVTISGTGFKTGALVTFGGLSATTTVLSDTQITAVTPAHSVGTVDVTINNTDGSSNTLSSGFRYGQIIFSNGFESGDFSAWSFSFADTRVTINTNPAFVHRGTKSTQIRYALCNPSSPTTALTFSQVAGGTLLARTYFVRYNYVSGAGNLALPSAEQQVSVAANNLLVVNSPPTTLLLVSYNLYMSKTSGTETLQNATPIPIGTKFTEPVTGLTTTGTPPPTTPTTCGGSHQDDNQFFEKDFTTANGFPVGLQHFFLRGYLYLKTPEPDGTVNNTFMTRKLFYLKSPAGAGGSPDFLFAVILGLGGTLSGGDTILRYGVEAPDGTTTNVGAGSIGTVTFDQWHSLEIEVQVNTSGVSNGVVNIWLDGTRVIAQTGLNIRGTLSSGITRMEIGRQTDRDNFIPVDEFRFWDDVIVADAYVDPNN